MLNIQYKQLVDHCSVLNNDATSQMVPIKRLRFEQIWRTLTVPTSTLISFMDQTIKTLHTAQDSPPFHLVESEAFR